MRKLLSFFVSLLLLVSACADDEVLTQASAQPYIAEADSGFFDLGKVLCGSKTATHKLLIHNPNAGELRLSSVRVTGAEASCFHINVDGMSGSEFTESDFLSIARGDSLHVLVEALFPSAQSEREVLHHSSLEIVCNGVTTSLELRCTSHQADVLRDYTLSASETWSSTEPDRHLFGTLTIPEHTTLTIGPGVTLFLHSGAGIEVKGSLSVQGTLQEPVTLMGDRLDRLFDNLQYADMPSQWQGITFFPSAQSSRIEHAVIKGMTTGLQLREHTLDVSASRLINADSSLVCAVDSRLTLTNSLLQNSRCALLELQGGTYDITHCTLANYNYWARFEQSDVVLHRPLAHCAFTNTIIYGGSDLPCIDIEAASSSGIAPSAVFDYVFDHCLLKSAGEDDSNFLSCLWATDPLYLKVDPDNYYLDPHLSDASPALGRGVSEPVSSVVSDLDGKARPVPPSIGCYE